MSPEPAIGEKVIDARSDLYALGAVTYEMLAGDPLFTGSSCRIWLGAHSRFLELAGRSCTSHSRGTQCRGCSDERACVAVLVCVSASVRGGESSTTRA